MQTIQTRRAMIAWLAAALCHLVETLHRTFPAAAFVGLAADLGADAAAMGLIGSAYFFIYMFMQVPGGLLGDTYGPVPVYTVGTVVAGIGSLVLAASHSIAQAFIGRFLVGLGVAVIFVNVLALQAELFSPAIFATLSGWVAFLGNIGSVVGMAPLAKLCDRVGWRRAAQLLALVSGVVAVVAWVAGRPFNRKQEKKGSQNLRAQAGTLFTTGGVKAVLLSYFCTCGPLMAIVTLWGMPYIMSIWEVSSAQAAASLGLIPLATMISAPLLGTLADRLGKKRPLLLSCYGLQTAALVALLMLSPDKASYWTVSLCCFLLGIPNSMYVLFIAEMKDRSPKEMAGFAVSIANFIGFLGAFILQLVTGGVINLVNGQGQITGVYTTAALRAGFGFCLAVTCVGFVACYLIPAGSHR